MASIAKYQAASGVRWRVQYTDPTKKRRTKTGFKTKKAAEHWCAENIIERNTGSWIDPQKQRITVADIHKNWVKRLNKRKESYRRQNEINWKNHVQPRWGNVQVGQISQIEVQQWVDELNLAASTIRHLHSQLAGILDYAMSMKAISTNPARGINLPKKAAPRHVYLTPQQLSLFVSSCTTKGDLALLLGTTGLRWGEAVALRPMDIDFEARRIRIERAAVTSGGATRIDTPKTGEARTVTAPKFVFDTLRESCEGVAPGDLIWPSANGGPLRNVSHDSWWGWALKRAQKADPTFPKITPHSLRHVAAGLLVGSGASVKAVQRQLGHATAAMTLDQYSDLFDGDLDTVAAAMDEVFSLTSSNLRQIVRRNSVTPG